MTRWLRKRSVRLSLVAAAATVVLVSVAVGWIMVTSRDTSLDGTRWILVSYGTRENPQGVLSGTEINLQFSKGEAGGSAGCNRFTAKYEAKGNTLQFGPIASTKMMCPEGIMQQETVFLSALGSIQSFRITGSTIEIAYQGGILRFTAR